MKSAEIATWIQVVVGIGSAALAFGLLRATKQLAKSTDAMSSATNDMAKAAKMQATEAARSQLIEVFKNLSEIQSLLTDIQKFVIETPASQFRFSHAYELFNESLRAKFGMFVLYCPLWMDGEEDERCVNEIKGIHIEIYGRMINDASDRKSKKEFFSFLGQGKLTVGAVGEHLQNKLDAIPRVRFET